MANEQNLTSVRKEQISKLKQKMDSIVEVGKWDFDDVFKDHNYCNINSTVFECVVYFLTGLVDIILNFLRI